MQISWMNTRRQRKKVEPSDDLLRPEEITVWILAHGGDVFFAGFAFSIEKGLQVLASKNIDDSWMFPDEKTAVETRRDDSRLHTYQIVPVRLQKIPRIWTPPSTNTPQ